MNQLKFYHYVYSPWWLSNIWSIFLSMKLRWMMFSCTLFHPCFCMKTGTPDTCLHLVLCCFPIYKLNCLFPFFCMAYILYCCCCCCCCCCWKKQKNNKEKRESFKYPYKGYERWRWRIRINGKEVAFLITIRVLNSTDSDWEYIPQG